VPVFEGERGEVMGEVVDGLKECLFLSRRLEKKLSPVLEPAPPSDGRLLPLGKGVVAGSVITLRKELLAILDRLEL